MTSLLDGISAFFDQFKSKAQEDQASNAITIIQAVQTQELMQAVASIFPPAVLAIPSVKLAYDTKTQQLSLEKDTGPYGDIAKGLVAGFKTLEIPISQAVASLLSQNLTGDPAGINAALAEVLDPVLEVMISTMSAGGESVPPNIAAKLKSSLMPLLTLGLTWEIATDITELAMPTKMLGTGGIAHFIHDTIGFSSLSDAYTRPVREALIEVPARYNIMTLMQPWGIRPQEAVALLQKRQITADQYKEVLRYTGIQERYLSVLGDIAWRELSMRDMQRMFDVGRPDRAWLITKVKRMGFRDEDVPNIIDSLYQRDLVKDVGDIRTVQRSEYKAGVISRSDYTKMLQGRGLTVDEVTSILDAVDAERDYEDKDENAKLWERKFLNARADEGQLRTALANLGKTDAYIDARIKLLTEQKLGKLKAAGDDKILPEASIARAYKLRKITKTDAAKRIDDMGYSTADANLLVDMEDGDDAAAVTAEWIRAGEEQALMGRMEILDLQAWYVKYGKSEEWATARAAYINQRVLGKEKKASATASQTAGV
jgi:hypothetical protein